MPNQVYLGIDLGAESGRVVAGLWDGQNLRVEELHRFANGPVNIGDTLRWDVLRLWAEIQNGLSLAARRFAGKISSVGVDGWGVDFVLLSKSGEMMGQPYHYRDSRTNGILEQALQKVPRSEVFAASGLQFMEINTLYQLLALKKQSPEVLDAADRLLMIPDFINWCLSGAKVAEFTNATTTQCLHPTKRQWSSDMLQRFDLPAKIFPEIVSPGTRLGPLRPIVASATGLEKVSVIAPATHDTASAVAAIPAASARQNWAYISSGTWSLVGIESPEAQLSPRVLDLNFTNEGGVDGTYRLLKNVTGLWLVQQCRKSFAMRGADFTYSDLAQLAEAAPALCSLIDPDDARFLNPPDMPRAIQDYCAATAQPVPQSEGALIRCVLESLALKYQVVLGWLEELTGEKIEVIHIVGGGSRNDLLNQFTANATARPVLAGPVEATALGNLLMQMRATGECGSLSEMRDIVRKSSELRRFEPKPASLVQWEEARGKFLNSFANCGNRKSRRRVRSKQSRLVQG